MAQLQICRNLARYRLVVATARFAYFALKSSIASGRSSAFAGSSPSSADRTFSWLMIVARLFNGSTSMYRVRYVASRLATVAGLSPTLSRFDTRRGSVPHAISAMNFGSQTFSASCFDVIDAVAPRANAKSSTGIR